MSTSDVKEYAQDEVVACRACLCTGAGAELHNLHDNDLAEVFADLSGFPVVSTDGYPQLICSKCLHVLRKLLLFRRRCQSSMYMLQKVLANNVKITTEFLAALERKCAHNLMKSNVIIIRDVDVTPSGADNNESTPLTADDVIVINNNETTPSTLDKEKRTAKKETKKKCIDNRISIKSRNKETTPLISDNVIVLTNNETTPSTADEEIDNDENTVSDEVIVMTNNDATPLVAKDTVNDFNFKFMGTDNNHKYNVSTKDNHNIVGSEDLQTGCMVTAVKDGRSDDGENEIKPDFVDPVYDRHEDISSSNCAPTEEYMNETKIISKENAINATLCCICGYTTSDVTTLNAHLETHAASNSFACDMCPFITVRKIALIQHIKTHTAVYNTKSETKVELPISNKHIIKKLKRKSHLKIVKSFLCKVCQRTFKVKRHFIYHQMSHTGDKPYSCDYCHKNFTQKSHLYTHIKSHASQKLYSCDFCEKDFTYRNSLTRHLKLHTNEKPHTCDFCHKGFKQKCNLSRHKKLVHSGKHPYTCDICHKTFRRESHLHSHKNIHTGPKPYTCDVCHKHFGYRSTLNGHKKIHTGEKPFSCDVCHKKFRQVSNLCRHRKIHKKP